METPKFMIVSTTVWAIYQGELAAIQAGEFFDIENPGGNWRRRKREINKARRAGRIMARQCQGRSNGKTEAV